MLNLISDLKPVPTTPRRVEKNFHESLLSQRISDCGVGWGQGLGEVGTGIR